MIPGSDPGFTPSYDDPAALAAYCWGHGRTQSDRSQWASCPLDGAVREVVCSTFWLGIPGGDGRTGLPRETIAANADDPVVHASPSMLFTPTGEGRPWLPVVSFVHAGADFIESLGVPAGSGHRYGSDQPDRLQTCD